jgi:hypothetical protein
VGAFAGRAVAGAVFVGEDAKDFKHAWVATDVMIAPSGPVALCCMPAAQPAQLRR